MRIGRTLPPAAAPLDWTDICRGVLGMFVPEQSIRALEATVRQHFGVRHVFLVSSGAAGLTLTLSALRSLASDRTSAVIPAYTCFSVPAAVLKAGLQPVLCDINADTFDFDFAELERTLDHDTLCVVAHHLFGIGSDIERIRSLCQARGIVVVEDAAQAMGVESNGRSLGTFGDVGIFSLGRGKPVTCGGGGIVVTDSDEIAQAIDRQYRQLEAPALLSTLKEFAGLVLLAAFIRPRLYWLPAALPFLRLGETIFPTDIPLKRLSGMKAAVLERWPARLTRANTLRSETSAYFSRRLSLALPHGPSHPYLRLPVRIATARIKQELRALSAKRGLGLSDGYPTPVNEIRAIRAAFEGQAFPAAKRVADHLLTIPTHHWLSDKDKRAIADCFAATSTVRPRVEWQEAS